MGARGPIPKRSENRRRRNHSAATSRVTAQGSVARIPLAFSAHPIAAEWYASLTLSGQTQFFEPSDWQAARLVAFDLTRHLNSGRVSAQMFSALWSAMADLLTTEAARRRVRLEIERTNSREDAPNPAHVAAMDAYRRNVGAQ
jgi:hypothetical protein